MVYFVATPIGNLSELSPRAQQVLGSVTAILCEDTRHSKGMLERFGISNKLYSYHKFNERSMVAKAIELAQSGDIAVISDAGMPGINDPGTILVNALIEHDIEYTVVSGPSALINAFVISGYSAPFAYMGFLPEKNKDRQELLASVANSNCVLIVYVSVHDLERDRVTLYDALGARAYTLVRELTKLHEQVVRGTLDQPFPVGRGEYVLVIDRGQIANSLLELTPLEHLQHYIDSGMDKATAIKTTAKDRAVPKNDIYKLTVDK